MIFSIMSSENVIISGPVTLDFSMFTDSAFGRIRKVTDISFAIAMVDWIRSHVEANTRRAEMMQDESSNIESST